MPLIEIVMMSTPSAMASSKAARMCWSLHPFDEPQTLYAAILADGTPPRAMPFAIPKKLASATLLPAAVEAVWVP